MPLAAATLALRALNNMNRKDVRMPLAAIGDNASRSMAKSVFGKSQIMKEFGSEERAFGSE
jgi:hypothetical protein